MRPRLHRTPHRSSLLWTLPGLIALPAICQAQDAIPRTALVTSVKGRQVTLGVGANDGAQKGAIYRIARGNTAARVQIVEVRAGDSTANVIGQSEGFVVTVGDTGQFVAVEELQQALPSPSGPLEDKPPVMAPNPAPAEANAPTTSPQNPLITAVSGKTVTLSGGSQDGMQLGALYSLPREGATRATLQVTTVRGANSTATVVEAEEGYVITVGDTPRFVGIRALPAPPKPVEPVVQPPVIGTPVTPVPPGSITIPLPPKIYIGPAPVMTPLTGSTATVISTEGTNVTVNAGTQQGVTTATNLPILRGGVIIGLMRVSIVGENSSTGTLLWRDETLGAISPGDAVGILGAAPTTGMPQIGPVKVEDTVPAVPVRYETGASNITVPKAGRTYELLAALAASKLITSQPPHVFHDDGTRRHRTAEDITFSRAQVATFIREAIGNAGESESGKGRAALAQLVTIYRKDLEKQGVSAETLAEYNGSSQGFMVGFSGQTRATLVGGTTMGVIDPIPERFGGRRSRTGFDSRTDIFGQINPNLQFFAKIDSGTDLKRGGNDNNFTVRDAFLSYNARNLLRGLTIEIGRKEYWWGTGHFGTTLLGDTAGGLNSIHTSFERGSYKYESLYAPLGGGPAGGPRSLYGQNLSVKIGQQTKLGIANTVLSAKDKFDPRLFFAAFTPISLYTADRFGSDRDTTNAVVQGYIETGLARGVQLYGEVVLDDLSLNSNSRVQNRNGGVVGFHLFTPKDPTKLGLYTEYGRLNSISYLAFRGPTRDADYDYYDRGAPLGYPVAPVFPTNFGGADSLRFDGYWKPTKKLRLHGSVQFADINSEDQDPSRARPTFADPTKNPNAGFFRQQIFRFAASYDLSRSFTLTGRVQRVSSDQPNFIYLEPSVGQRLYSLEISRAF